MSTPTASNPPAGFYDDGSGRQRWYDGTQWTDHYQNAPVRPPTPPTQPVHATGPATAASLNVKREVMYTRQQKGHSLTLWVILSLFLLFPVIGLVYYSVSPNHYWHA